MLEKTRSFLKKSKSKIKYAYTFMVTMMLLSANAYAGEIAEVQNEEFQSNADNYIRNLILILCDIFRYVGIALFVWGAIQFILSVKRTDAESKSDAMQTAIVGIALISVRFIVDALGVLPEAG